MSNNVPGPSVSICVIASLIVTYVVEHSSLGMPAIIELSLGYDRWTISRHLFC